MAAYLDTDDEPVRRLSRRTEGRAMSHLAVPKTYKLYIGGAFPRSESGRTYPAPDAAGGFLANAARASRKDARDAVAAARKGFDAWSKATPYNRGQVIYRIAEMLDGRRAQFVELIMISGGAKTDAAGARSTPPSTGWCTTPAGPTSWPPCSAAPTRCPGRTSPTPRPEPTGVVGILAPTGPPLLGLVSVIAPVITGGNACVVVAAEPDPCVAITFAEVLATSDLPGGVVNILTGSAAEIGAAPGRPRRRQRPGPHRGRRRSPARLEQAAAETVKRVYVPKGTPDFAAPPGTARLRAFLEIKTVWHPTGALSLAGGTPTDQSLGMTAMQGDPGPHLAADFQHDNPTTCLTGLVSSAMRAGCGGARKAATALMLLVTLGACSPQPPVSQAAAASPPAAQPPPPGRRARPRPPPPHQRPYPEKPKPTAPPVLASSGKPREARLTHTGAGPRAAAGPPLPRLARRRPRHPDPERRHRRQSLRKGQAAPA